MANKTLCVHTSDCPYLMSCFLFRVAAETHPIRVQWSQLNYMFRVIHQINSCPRIICIQITTFTKLCIFQGSKLPADAEHRQQEHRDIFHNLLHSRNSLTLGARQESLSPRGCPRECSKMERKIFFFWGWEAAAPSQGTAVASCPWAWAAEQPLSRWWIALEWLNFVSPLLDSRKWSRAVHPADVGPHMFILQNSWLLTLALTWQENTTAAAHCWWQLLLWELNSFCTP